ncbi:MAG TPA: FixH family protein [Planctomycetota bacterium]|nr:FixH family protein [Planctomycetota bacterium]
MIIRTKNAVPGSGPIRPSVVLLLTVLLVAGSGCEPGKPAQGLPSKDSACPPQPILSNWGGYRVTYRPSTGTIPLNEPFDIRFSIEPIASTAEGADVAVDAEMPAHHHGMTRSPQVSRVGKGSYLATGLLFHMPGHWQLHFDITQDGRTDRAEVGIDLQ